MSFPYHLFGKIITLDDFVAEARKRGLQDIEVAPLCYDNDIFKYDPKADGKRAILHQSITSINVWTTKLGDNGYPELSLEAKKLRFGEEYYDGRKKPLVFQSMEELDTYQAKMNQKGQERRKIECRETLKIKEQLVECDFEVK